MLHPALCAGSIIGGADPVFARQFLDPIYGSCTNLNTDKNGRILTTSVRSYCPLLPPLLWPG